MTDDSQKVTRKMEIIYGDGPYFKTFVKLLLFCHIISNFGSSKLCFRQDVRNCRSGYLKKDMVNVGNWFVSVYMALVCGVVVGIVLFGLHYNVLVFIKFL